MKVRGSTGAPGVRLDAEIHRHDVQHLQVLALVFVNALYQDVEHRAGIDEDPGALERNAGEIALVRLLDLAPAGPKPGILGERLEGFECRQILDPALADMLGDELRQVADWRAP